MKLNLFLRPDFSGARGENGLGDLIAGIGSLMRCRDPGRWLPAGDELRPCSIPRCLREATDAYRDQNDNLRFDRLAIVHGGMGYVVDAGKEQDREQIWEGAIGIFLPPTAQAQD